MSVTYGLGEAEAEADGGVGEGHDGGEDGEPGDLVEVGDLREEDLRHAEDDHVRRAGDIARVPVPLHVEAVRPLDRPVDVHAAAHVSSSRHQIKLSSARLGTCGRFSWSFSIYILTAC